MYISPKFNCPRKAQPLKAGTPDLRPPSHAEPAAVLGKASEIPLGCMNENFLESGRLAEVQLENMRPQRRKWPAALSKRLRP